jgi:Flp pilus assembly protein TadD
MKQRGAEENFVRAIADFNQVLRLNPNDTDAREDIEYVRQRWRAVGIDKPAP